MIYAKKLGKFKLYKEAKVKAMMPINEVLANAVNDLTKEDEPWIISTEGNSIIARINWKNTTNISFVEINNEMQNFEYCINLFDDYKYTEGTESTTDTASIELGSTSANHSAFYGLELRDFHSIEFGVNHNTDEKGIIKRNIKQIKILIIKYFLFTKIKITTFKLSIKFYLFSLSCGTKKEPPFINNKNYHKFLCIFLSFMMRFLSLLTTLKSVPKYIIYLIFVKFNYSLNIQPLF